MHDAVPNYELPRQQVISEISAACEQVAEHPPQVDGKRDEIVAMMARSLLNVLQDPTLTNEHQLLTKGVIDCRRQDREVTGKLVFDYFRCVFNFRNYDPESGNGYPWTSQATWDEYVRDEFYRASKAPGEPFSSLEDFVTSMLMWRNSTNEPRRIAGTKLASLLVLGEERCANSITLASIGASLGRGVAMLAKNAPLEVEIYDPSHSDPNTKPASFQIVNALLAKRFAIQEGVCIDLMNPRTDDEWRQFAKACCYPSELSDPEKRALNDQLDTYLENASNITHIGSVFGLSEKASPELQALQEKGKTIDVTDANAMLHQNPLKIRRAIFDGMLQITRDDGLIVISEHVHKVNRQPRHPVERLTTIGPTAEPYTFSTWVYDMQQPGKGLQLFFSWDSGRCARVWVHDAAIRYYKANRS